MPRPLVILLPGTDGTALFFSELTTALEKECDVRCFPYPETGEQSYAALGQLLLPQLPTDRDYVLLGESFGGPLAVWLATQATHPPIKLILGATFAASPFGFLGRAASPLVPLARFIPLRRWQIRLMLFNGGHAAWANRIFDKTCGLDRRTLLARVISVLTCDMREALASFNGPVLCLNASKDRLLPPWLPRHFPKEDNIRVVDLSLPHMMFQADPLGIATTYILPFIREEVTSRPLS
ncbi:alpha/beta hydrolase [Asticcacaulis sp. DW145]|uniref:alpha/beta fold hydrolase n=1 Tax=Asticcacaulis sp. DW145 TaxID=3095608 RepID=UPI00308EA62D|nr:alpha/beta hydrolase [Asticcacaulis sp. DW145]